MRHTLSSCLIALALWLPAPLLAQDALADVEALAMSGDAHAQVAYALALLDGTEVAYDAARAGQLAETAAAAGNRQAMLLLSSMLEHGLGMPQDLVRADALLNAAADDGSPDALYHRAMKTVEQDPDQALLDFQWAGAQGHVPSLQVLATLQFWEENPASEENAAAEAPAANPNLVIAIQALLLQLGYEPGPPNGQLGDNTVAAIKAFQTDAGFVSDGAATAELRAALADAARQK